MASLMRNAKKFARTVKLNSPYYSIDAAGHSGNTYAHFVREWVFSRRSRLTGQPMCGHMSAAGVYLYTRGEISETRPPGYTTEEVSKMNNVAAPPLEGYEAPAGWFFQEGADPESLWEGIK